MSKYLDESYDIIEKDNLTIIDYFRMKELRKLISQEDEVEFLGNYETFYSRLPEIAEKTGGYNFLEEEDK